MARPVDHIYAGLDRIYLGYLFLDATYIKCSFVMKFEGSMLGILDKAIYS